MINESDKITREGIFMFVNFRFDNFLSYNDLTHFSLVAGNTRRHSQHVVKHPDVNVLKFAALYGANASGKSNLIQAIKFSRQVILYGFPKVVSRYLHSKINIETLRLNMK